MPFNSVDVLKAKVDLALRDRRVTQEEAESLISLVKDGGGVTNSERRQLREAFIANEDRFEPAAVARMKRFIDTEISTLLVDESVSWNGTGRNNLEDPAVLEEDKTVLRYEWTRGDLFKNGPDEGDVVQGMIGDCYLVAAFGAVAAQSPADIQRAIRDNGDGTYSVRFFDLSFGGRREVTVTIDGELPVRLGGLRYGKCHDRSELWVGILEKAYAKWQGSYDAIGHGGRAGNVMAALTGRPHSYLPVSPSSNPDALFRQVKDCLDQGHSAAAGTHGKDRSDLYKGTGLYANHAYSILGAEEVNGTKYLVLRNPWGEVEPKGNGEDDGVFRLDLATFTKLYPSVYMS